MVFRQDRPWLVAGSPGTDRILSSVMQFLSGVLDGSLPICQAMRRPRLHCSHEGLLSIESGRFDPGIVKVLKEKAVRFSQRRDHSFYLGAIHAALCCFTKNQFQGSADIRRDGIAAGVG
jgi:gamma-glutamyltranspeptidase/glutathione hydrolase